MRSNVDEPGRLRSPNDRFLRCTADNRSDMQQSADPLGLLLCSGQSIQSGQTLIERLCSCILLTLSGLTKVRICNQQRRLFRFRSVCSQKGPGHSSSSETSFGPADSQSHRAAHQTAPGLALRQGIGTCFIDGESRWLQNLVIQRLGFVFRVR